MIPPQLALVLGGIALLVFVFAALIMSAPETPPVEDLEAFYPEVEE